jgi:hypothetical protein
LEDFDGWQHIQFTIDDGLKKYEQRAGKDQCLNELGAAGGEDRVQPALARYVTATEGFRYYVMKMVH